MIKSKSKIESFPNCYNFVRIDNHKMHFVDSGSGQPVLMIHGNFFWSFFYRFLIKALAPTHRVIAPDLIGFGLSDKPRKRFKYTMKGHIESLEKFIDELELKNIKLVAHGLGANIALGLLVNRPELFSDITLLNPTTFNLPRTFSNWMFFHIVTKNPLCIPIFQISLRPLRLFLIDATKAISIKDRKMYLQPYDSYRKRVGIQRLSEDIPLSPLHRSMPVLKRIRRKSKKIAETMPVNVLCCHHSTHITKNLARNWEKEFPSANIKIFNNQNHAMLEEEDNEVIQYIKEIYNA